MPTVTTSKTFICEMCSAVLDSQLKLDNHMCLVHDDCGEARLGTPITFRCIACGEAFTRRTDLYAHLQQSGHGHPAEWDMSRPPGTKRPLGRTRGRKD